MLVHLVQNKQLKKPIKKQLPITYMLIDGTGVLYLPVCLTIASPQIRGMPLASFELQIGKTNEVSLLTTAKTFGELLTYFREQFVPALAVKDLQKVLQSQSLTITYVIEQLQIPRVDAKEFIDRCVNVGAFKKYYSYWVRTDIFSSWMANHNMTQHEEK